MVQHMLIQVLLSLESTRFTISIKAFSHIPFNYIFFSIFLETIVAMGHCFILYQRWCILPYNRELEPYSFVKGNCMGNFVLYGYQ